MPWMLNLILGMTEACCRCCHPPPVCHPHGGMRITSTITSNGNGDVNVKSGCDSDGKSYGKIFTDTGEGITSGSDFGRNMEEGEKSADKEEGIPLKEVES